MLFWNNADAPALTAYALAAAGRDRPFEEAEPPEHCQVHRHDSDGGASSHRPRVSPKRLGWMQ